MTTGIAIVVGVVINVLVWVYLFGKRGGTVNERLDNVEKRLDNPKVLDECSSTFTEMGKKLSRIEGKVGVICDILQKKD